MEQVTTLILKSFFVDSRTKINSEAASLCDHLVELYLSEALTRSIAIAKQNKRTSVSPEDFENIIVQIFLDFSA